MGFRFFKLLLLYALQAQLSQFIMAGPLSIKAIDICAQSFDSETGNKSHNTSS